MAYHLELYHLDGYQSRRFTFMQYTKIYQSITKNARMLEEPSDGAIEKWLLLWRQMYQVLDTDFCAWQIMSKNCVNK
jgi:hypothetical protein